ncbi:MAG: hypothetical protein IPJ85_07245 [Flavobacteriales bacterium]|nr:hypothetical protein [Flavobacteriales bacterium]
MNNGNWAKTLLFTLIGFGLGWAICCLTCGRCGGGSCDREKAACHAEASCGHGAVKGKCCKADGKEAHEHHEHGSEMPADSTHAH